MSKQEEEKLRDLFYKEFPEESAGCDGCTISVRYRNEVADYWLKKIADCIFGKSKRTQQET